MAGRHHLGRQCCREIPAAQPASATLVGPRRPGEEAVPATSVQHLWPQDCSLLLRQLTPQTHLACRLLDGTLGPPKAGHPSTLMSSHDSFFCLSGFCDKILQVAFSYPLNMLQNFCSTSSFCASSSSFLCMNKGELGILNSNPGPL